MFIFNIMYSDIYNIDHYVFGMDGSNGDYCRLTSADSKIDLIAIQCTSPSNAHRRPIRKLYAALQNVFCLFFKTDNMLKGAYI